MEDFDSFNPVRLQFKPDQPSYLKILFLLKEGQSTMQVLVAKKGDDEASNRLVIEGTDKPDEISIFSELIKFKDKLVKAVAVPNVNEVADILDNAPYFCQNMNFKKIIWDEFHEPVRKSDRGLRYQRTKKKAHF